MILQEILNNLYTNNNYTINYDEVQFFLTFINSIDMTEWNWNYLQGLPTTQESADGTCHLVIAAKLFIL